MSNQRYRDSINVSNDFSSKVLVVSRDLKKKLLIPSIVNNHLVMYPTPTSLTYFWNFGSLAGFFLVIQIVSGLFLAMHYSSDIKLAFDSVEHIMRDVNYGWQIRYAHANGASMFLFIVYIHMARGLFYKSYISPRETLWYTGVTLFLLLMATAFLGYVLPWGQMSFWGATVITNLASAIPIVGPKIALWLWGGFSVANATLTRFFALHFLLPLVMVGLTLVHLAELHQSGSSAPAGTEDSGDFMPFYPYFLIKDFFGFTCFLFFYFALIYYEPNMLGHPDNYIRANPLVTPAHIVPEWYFLPFYAILRSVPSKLGGVVLMGGAIVILYFLPTINSFKVRWFSKFKLPSIDFFIKPFTLRLVFKKAKFFKVPRMYWQFSIFFSFWVVSFLLLGILGGKPVEFPYSELSVVSAVYYFFFLIYFA